MNILRVATDSLTYPFRNIKSLAIPFILVSVALYIWKTLLSIFIYSMPQIPFMGSMLEYFYSSSSDPTLSLTSQYLFLNALQFVLELIPVYFLLTALTVGIVRNVTLKEPVNTLVLDRTLNSRELGTFKTWLKIFLLVLLGDAIVQLALFFFGSGFPEARSLITYSALWSLIFETWHKIQPMILTSSTYGYEYITREDFVGSAILLAPNILHFLMTYIIWSLLGLALITSALDKGNSLKEAFHLAKKRWWQIFLTLLTIDLIINAVTLVLHFLRIGLGHFLTFGTPSELYDVQLTNYANYLYFPNLFLVTVVTIYMAAFSKIYTSLKQENT